MAVKVFGQEELDMLREILEKKALFRGTYVKMFEEAFARAFGRARAVAMNSAMSELHGAVAASGATQGDEVICDPIMCFGAVAVMYNCSIPVFADVQRDSYNADPARTRPR